MNTFNWCAPVWDVWTTSTCNLTWECSCMHYSNRPIVILAGIPTVSAESAVLYINWAVPLQYWQASPLCQNMLFYHWNVHNITACSFVNLKSVYLCRVGFVVVHNKWSYTTHCNSHCRLLILYMSNGVLEISDCRLLPDNCIHVADPNRGK